MSQDTENFEQLRRLLALKRHEQPPPGYFNDFSSQVIARIKLGESGDRGFAIEHLLWEAPWLQRIWAAFEAKPVLAGVFGVAVCGLLITGVIYSDRTDVPPIALLPVAEWSPTPWRLPTVSAANHPLLAKPVAFEPSSTSPICCLRNGSVAPRRHRKLRAEPPSFTLPRGN